MTYSLAVAGKGGSGKTTTAALIIGYLIRHSLTPVLAVDADGNANLHESLGLTLQTTVGAVVAGFNEEKIALPPGITKAAYLDMKLNGAVRESKGVDLISMGRGEGSGCYCYPNSVLKEFIDRLKANYRCMVMDNEAGMEHLSRRTTENIDDLLIISDHSVKGVRTLGRIKELVYELKLDIKRVLTLIARVPGGCLDDPIKTELEELGISLAGIIPLDDAVLKSDLARTSLLNLPESSPAVCAVSLLMDNLTSSFQEVRRDS
jgi:CO dehydrogenase maturation factor